jgi:hypothetical protein
MISFTSARDLIQVKAAKKCGFPRPRLTHDAEDFTGKEFEIHTLTPNDAAADGTDVGSRIGPCGLRTFGTLGPIVFAEVTHLK